MTQLHLLPGQDQCPDGPRERSAPHSGSKKSNQPHPCCQ